jgi:hydrogenase-4 component B
MLMFFLLSLLGTYAVGIVLPLCVPRMPQMQGVLGSVCGCVASIFGIALGIGGLIASEPLTSSVASTIPFLAFAVRLDPLASFFVLTISLAGLAASIYLSQDNRAELWYPYAPRSQRHSFHHPLQGV